MSIVVNKDILIEGTGIKLENIGKYSTTETKIGTWIDGKPIYRKVVTLTSTISVPANAWTNTGITIANIDKLLLFKNTLYLNLYSAKYNNSIEILAYTSAPMLNGSYCIVEYTKTTD